MRTTGRCHRQCPHLEAAARSWLSHGSELVEGLGGLGEGVGEGLVPVHVRAAGALLATRPDAAAIIQGAAETCVPESPASAPFSLIVTEALGEERARELRARGADMDWDQALAYTLTQATQALDEPGSGTQP